MIHTIINCTKLPLLATSANTYYSVIILVIYLDIIMLYTVQYDNFDYSVVFAYARLFDNAKIKRYEDEKHDILTSF